MRCSALIVSLAILGAPGLSWAAESASDFQLYVLRDLNLIGQNIGKRAAVGGNATFTGTSIGGATISSPASLVVGGNLTYKNGGSIAGQALVGGSNQAFSYMPVTAGVSSLPVDFSLENLRLKNLSTTLAATSANGVAELKWGGLHLTGQDAGLNVFNIEASALSQATWFNANISPGSQVLINVLGGNVNMTGGLSFHQSSNILWNFADASSIRAGNVSIGGSILAPNATFYGGGGTVVGNMVVGAFDGAMSFGGSGYAGSLLTPPPVQAPPPLASGPVGAVPEPTTWAMMLLGFFGLGALLRRSRRQGGPAIAF